MTNWRRLYWKVAYALNPFSWMVRGRYVLPFHRCSGCRRWFSTRRRLFTDMCSNECVDRAISPFLRFDTREIPLEGELPRFEVPEGADPRTHFPEVKWTP